MSLTSGVAEQLAVEHFTAMATGDPDLARRCIHPEQVNHEAVHEPPACRVPGVSGFLATSAWLRLAFADLHFDILQLITEDDTTAAHVRMTGRQTGPFVVFPADNAPVAFPPTGRAFTVRQLHLLTIRGGLHAEHAAVRDDLGMMTQLGHLPPSPTIALRMARWNLTGAARRAVQQAVDLAGAGGRLSHGASV